MNPRIIDYVDGNLIILPETMMIPEFKVFVDKYGEEGAKPYLAYIYLLNSIDSPYRNLELEERYETAIYDVINTIGDFDIDDEDLEPALQKAKRLWTTSLMLFFEEMENELHRWREYMKNNPISSDDMDSRFKVMKDAGALIGSYKKAQAAALEELKAKARGKGRIGDY